MSVGYDNFGRKANSVGYRHGELEPYIVDAATDGATYICYTDDPLRAIRRIVTANGVTTVEVAFGAWADRASLEYHCVNFDLQGA